jgi:hypothetical protein
MMARARILLAALLAVSALAVLAVPAAASTPAANTKKFCKALNSIQGDLEDAQDDASSLNRNTLSEFADGLKAAGKQAPPKVKKAANNLASFYKGLYDGDASAIAKASSLGTSFSTFFTYVSTKCS